MQDSKVTAGQLVVRSCLLLSLFGIFLIGGVGFWCERSYSGYADSAERTLQAELEGKLAEAVAIGLASESSLKLSKLTREHYGQLRWFKVVRTGGYPREVSHGFATFYTIRGKEPYSGHMYLNYERASGWQESPATWEEFEEQTGVTRKEALSQLR